MPVSPTVTLVPGSQGQAPAGAAPPPGAEPGLVLLFACGRPFCALLPLSPSPTVIGRGQGVLSEHPDSTMSRRHAQVAYRDGGFVVTDLGSSNGIALNGAPLQGRAAAPAPSIFRFGDTLFYGCADLRPLRQLGVQPTSGGVLGPAAQLTLLAAAHIAEASQTLLLVGERGLLRAAVARAFHLGSQGRAAPLTMHSCAAAAQGSMAAAIEAQWDAADGGTLFLDEVQALDVAAQQSLRRALSASGLRVCAATDQELRPLAGAGTFCAGLCQLLDRPRLSLPSLAERLEEIPWLIAGQVQADTPGLAVESSLVESCLLHPWPGGADELTSRVRAAALAARRQGKRAVTAGELLVSAAHSERGLRRQAPGAPPDTAGAASASGRSRLR